MMTITKITSSLLMAAMLALCFSACVGPPDRGTTSRGLTRVQNPLEECSSNLKNIATALEMYATDNRGDFPESLTLLAKGNSSPDTPGKVYLKSIPSCPACKAGYAYEYNNVPDRFTLWCAKPGAHVDRQEVAKDGCWPQYTTGEGLITKP